MRKITLICDRCKHEEASEAEYELRELGWGEIKISSSNYNRISKEYLVCPECSKALGFIRNQKLSGEQEKSLADRIVECITEIVAEQMPG